MSEGVNWEQNKIKVVIGFTFLIYGNICKQYFISYCTHSVGKCHESRFLKLTKLFRSLRKNIYVSKIHLLYAWEHVMSQEVSLRRLTKDAWVGPQSSSYEVCSERNGTETSCFIHIHSFNTLRTGLLNCLNARSRGLTFRHCASCI